MPAEIQNYSAKTYDRRYSCLTPRHGSTPSQQANGQHNQARSAKPIDAEGDLADCLALIGVAGKDHQLHESFNPLKGQALLPPVRDGMAIIINGCEQAKGCHNHNGCSTDSHTEAHSGRYVNDLISITRAACGADPYKGERFLHDVTESFLIDASLPMT